MDPRIPEKKEIDAMTVQEYKVLENRMRRAAERQGLRLEKSRARDPNAIDFGSYQLIDQRHNTVVKRDWDMPRGYGLDLRDIGRYLFKPIAVHVDPVPDRGPDDWAYDDGEPMTFDDSETPILRYRTWSTTGLTDEHGKPLPDGWILHTADGDERIMASRFVDDVDEVVADAKEHLRRYYY